jgi:hypothetical protein
VTRSSKPKGPSGKQVVPPGEKRSVQINGRSYTTWACDGCGTIEETWDQGHKAGATINQKAVRHRCDNGE